jgi:predicted transcriptional regulator
MILHEIMNILNAEILACKNSLDLEVNAVKASDLMSDVLTMSDSGVLLLTGLTNVQAVRTAEIAELSAIIFVRGKKPEKETIELAERKNIPLLATQLPLYESCGLLFQNGLPGTLPSEKGL